MLWGLSLRLGHRLSLPQRQEGTARTGPEVPGRERAQCRHGLFAPGLSRKPGVR